MPLEVASCPNCGAPVNLSQHANVICPGCGKVFSSANSVELENANLDYLALSSECARLETKLQALTKQREALPASCKRQLAATEPSKPRDNGCLYLALMCCGLIVLLIGGVVDGAERYSESGSAAGNFIVFIGIVLTVLGSVMVGRYINRKPAEPYFPNNFERQLTVLNGQIEETKQKLGRVKAQLDKCVKAL